MIIDIQEDEYGELYLPLTEDICNQMGWTIGDTLKWEDNGDGSWSLSKMETELVLVEEITSFRIRYVVEVPKGKSEYALDTVVCKDATEFSQKHIGDQICSHRVINDEEFMKLFDEDNDYLAKWPDETKKNLITRWQGGKTNENLS